ncbi:major facilitator superfamily MFS_1 [Chthoniobacter flavus Ellin428]|uniref:Major facilitator superfamily MFS_1 n=1 Tax=Chthoniobacter flavus Ellin428 TaxID=497964 RepID=B4CWN5_9BACT|nr:MFS transporter [Chthoniobacter flavus]EDY21827.1 major facilitator superfamily MFS_1 [Chthoniobacter flavus Ellin428]TCO95754.1 MFS transporter [Chthoniobacter flavus]
MSETPSGATHVRYALLGVATANAFLLYLDRICMTTVVHSPSFLRELHLSEADVGNVLSSFFFAYALGQLPAGWLADRFGPRRMLVAYIVLWSACTALTGLATSIAAIVIVRLACGLSEAGAYPASARVISRWFPFGHRARANSFVAFGGRLGLALAPWLTVEVIARLNGWRPVLWIYGGIGLTLAAATFFTFRDEPALHPWTNEAERELIRSSGPPPSKPDYRFPWLELLCHRGLWLLSLGAIGLNFGWALLVTWLPKYLQSVRGLDEEDANFSVTIVLACGVAGVLFGGWWCDALSRWFGSRWGRRLPIIIGGLIGTAAYLVCPSLHSARGVIIACGLVAFATDSANPAIWTLSQDIGRGHVAATLAWSNMWGNLGASAVAKTIPLALASTMHRADWSEVFWMCAASFLIFAGCALFIDSTKPLANPFAPREERAL